jgi:hypothetical protein
MKTSSKTVLTALVLAAILLAGCATTNEELPEYDTNQDGMISDEEYHEASKQEDLLTSRQARTSMRNRDTRGAADTTLKGVNTAANITDIILKYTVGYRWRWW